MNKIKYFVGAVCLALSLNSCSDFLNEAAEFYLAALKKGEKRNGNRDDQQA